MTDNFWKRHPNLNQFYLSIGICLVLGICFTILEGLMFDTLGDAISFFLLFGMFQVYPIILTIHQIRLFWAEAVKKAKPQPLTLVNAIVDFWGLVVVFGCEFIVLFFFVDVNFSADWSVQLYNYDKHTPIWTEASNAVTALLLVALVGFFVLYVKSVNELPPLVSVLAISAIYMGMIWRIIWIIHIIKLDSLPFVLIAICPTATVCCMGGRVILRRVREYVPDSNRMSKIDGVPILRTINKTLHQVKTWPLLALLLLLPMLSVFIMVLVLFGQSPDILVKAFTETSEWNLSEKVSPPNVFRDEHYLCTVAAGGHETLVKPVRKGFRNGHPVIVNRQLLVANAFEQVLEEKIPTTHRYIRRVYDRYGFPIAKLIRSKWLADLIWLIMKPLEYVFVFVLYLCDKHPEDRITLQYTNERGRYLLSQVMNR